MCTAWSLNSASPLTLFYFSCTLWLSSPWAHHTSLLSTNNKRKQFVNRCSAANKLCLWLSLSHAIRKVSLTASIRPLSVGDFSIRASNTSSASFLTYSSTAERNKPFTVSYSINLCNLYTCVWSTYIEQHIKRDVNVRLLFHQGCFLCGCWQIHCGSV